MTWFDAHCHLANLAELYPLDTALAEARFKGISGFLSNALSKAELKWYAENAYRFGILYSAGVHPNFPPCDLDFADIQALAAAKKIWAVGEIGLDRMNKDFASMELGFIRQLDLAAQYQLPVVLHIVGHQQRAYEILRTYPLRYLVHGYAGSTQAFQGFLKLDAFFTLSERLLKRDKVRLLNEILESERYLLETDITQYYVKPGEANPLLRLLSLAEEISLRNQIDMDALKATQYRNYLDIRGEQA